MYPLLISAEDLRHLSTSDQPPLVFDCSFELNDANAGASQYRQKRIPGAIHAHLDQHLSDKRHPSGAQAGRHPLPSRGQFCVWLREQGLAQDQQVVVYDRQGANYCGRLWWMIKWCGHDAVAVLDGGLQAWEAAGFELESGPDTTARQPATHPFKEQTSLVRTVDSTEIAANMGSPDLTILDARATPRFRGEVEPLDPEAGHIPGALNRPFSLNLDANGRFKSPGQLKAEFEQLLAGRDPRGVVHHCGSGVSALPNLLGMAVAGLGLSALYPGSWSAWSNTPGTPRAKS
ncbi:MAG: sulfurtransferase [Burkholderiaceae bacterium]